MGEARRLRTTTGSCASCPSIAATARPGAACIESFTGGSGNVVSRGEPWLAVSDALAVGSAAHGVEERHHRPELCADLFELLRLLRSTCGVEPRPALLVLRNPVP